MIRLCLPTKWVGFVLAHWGFGPGMVSVSRRSRTFPTPYPGFFFWNLSLSFWCLSNTGELCISHTKNTSPLMLQRQRKAKHWMFIYIYIYILVYSNFFYHYKNIFIQMYVCIIHIWSTYAHRKAHLFPCIIHIWSTYAHRKAHLFPCIIHIWSTYAHRKAHLSLRGYRMCMYVILCMCT